MDWTLNLDLKARLTTLVMEGYKQSEVLQIITKEFDHYNWRTLQRRLNHFRIKRNDDHVSVHEVFSVIQEELKGTGKLLGYRSLHKKLRVVHGLRVKQKQVLLAMSVLDPDGLKQRSLVNKRKRFKRRVFTSKGPNWVWSIDGHDKLMGLHKSEFPLAIHGCVDTFSRKILWLKAWISNSSPKIPVRFYWELVQKNKVIAHFIRSDRGNENTTLYTVHNFLRCTSDGSSFLYGSSITNQVIERWWRDLRERNGNFIREALDELNSTGMYNSENETCRVILAVILIPLLQKELDIFKKCWNRHRIRKQNIRRPCGIPNFLYHHPDNFGCKSEGHEVDVDLLDFVEEKLNLTHKFTYVEDAVSECVQSILMKSNLIPITFSNFIKAYKTIFEGCKHRGIELTFTRLP